MKKNTWYAIILIFVIPSFLFGQEKIAVLPFRSVGIDSTSAETAYLLLLQEVEKSGKYQMVPESQIRQALNSSTCSEISCALDIGKKLNAAKVVFSSLNRLGEKLILQYSLVDVQSGQILLSDNMTASYIEDLDQVVKRVALSIANHLPVKKTAEVGLITEQESLKPNTRGTKSSWGFTFGQLYPQRGYDDEERIFVVEVRTMYEMEHFAVTGLFAIRKGFAFGVSGLYLFSRKDFSPYLGLGTGFHIVSHDNIYEYTYPYEERAEKQKSGIMANIQGGLLAFRTYHFHVLLNLEYSFTFNDYDDRGVVFTIGLLF